MKLGFYHYYFRERGTRKAPRVLHDIRPLLKAYADYENTDWKAEFKTEDGEHLLLLPAADEVHMLVGTRRADLIKAINAQTLSCSDISERLGEDEETGFAGYFTCSDRMIGMASTLRGPKTAALCRYINHVLIALGAGRWRFELIPLGGCVTLDEAKELSFVSRASIRLNQSSSLFGDFTRMFAQDKDDVASIEVIIRAKRGHEVNDAVKKVAEKIGPEGLDKMVVRARAMLDDELADYYVAAQGRFSEVIDSGTEQQIRQQIASKFAQSAKARTLLRQVRDSAHYETPAADEIEDLTRLGDVGHWRTVLRV